METRLSRLNSSTAIIGAGPAGCAAAIELARAGKQVVLLETSTFPRHRPGESLHPGVEVIFEKLGVADAVNSAGFVRHRTLSGYFPGSLCGRIGRADHHLGSGDNMQKGHRERGPEFREG